MRYASLLFCLCVLLLSGCSDTIIEPTESPFPASTLEGRWKGSIQYIPSQGVNDSLDVVFAFEDGGFRLVGRGVYIRRTFQDKYVYTTTVYSKEYEGGHQITLYVSGITLPLWGYVNDTNDRFVFQRPDQPGQSYYLKRVTEPRFFKTQP